MKIAALSAVAMLAFAFTIVAHSQETTKEKERPIHVAELNERPVIGRLGLPLGTVTEIQAQIISGAALRRKRDSSSYLLKVTHVAGDKLENAPILRFSVPTFRVKLANSNFDLYELKHGKKARSLDSAQIEKLEKGYVGKTVRLVVYEVGGFYGMPENLPKDIPGWQDVGFGFSTSLVALAERKSDQRQRQR